MILPFINMSFPYDAVRFTDVNTAMIKITNLIISKSVLFNMFNIILFKHFSFKKIQFVQYI